MVHIFTTCILHTPSNIAMLDSFFLDFSVNSVAAPSYTHKWMIGQNWWGAWSTEAEYCITQFFWGRKFLLISWFCPRQWKILALKYLSKHTFSLRNALSLWKILCQNKVSWLNSENFYPRKFSTLINPLSKNQHSLHLWLWSLNGS